MEVSGVGRPSEAWRTLPVRAGRSSGSRMDPADSPKLWAFPMDLPAWLIGCDRCGAALFLDGGLRALRYRLAASPSRNTCSFDLSASPNVFEGRVTGSVCATRKGEARNRRETRGS